MDTFHAVRLSIIFAKKRFTTDVKRLIRLTYDLMRLSSTIRL